MSLKNNVAWTLFGNVFYAGCQWGIIVILAKLTNTKTVGLFALALAVTAPIFLFSQLQLRAVQATDAKDAYQFGHYLGLRLISTVVGMIVAISVAFLSYDKKTALVIFAVALSKMFESISDLLYGLMQKHERMDLIAKSNIIKGMLSLIILSLFIFFTRNLLFGILGMAAVWGGLLYFFDLPNSKMLLNGLGDKMYERQSVVPIFDPVQLWKLAWLALPLGIVMSLLSLNANIPRYCIERYCGKSELGIFAALAYLVTAGGVIVNAMGQAVVPRLAQYYASGRTVAYRRLLMRLLLIGAAFGIFGISIAYYAGDIILGMIYSAEYAKKQDVFVWIMAAGGFAYIASFCGCGVTAARIFKAQLPVSILVISITTFAAYYFIPANGLVGAAYTLLISNTAVALLYLAILIR